MSDQVFSDPLETQARRDATRLLAQIQIRMHELSGMLDRETDPEQIATVQSEMQAQKWYHDLTLNECQRKGWL